MPVKLATPADVPELPSGNEPSVIETQFGSCEDGRYRLHLPAFGITVEVDRLRRERQELVGELAVYSQLPGTRTTNGGALSIADFNFSSARARQERAKLLAQRTQADSLDWIGVLEDFCQRVLAADRAGGPAIDLRAVPRLTADDALEVEGLSLLRRHPTILFGDGGAAKSYLALYVIGRLAERGLKVALFDWELAGDDHRDRLERLFGDAMPKVIYARCEKPLVYETDRLRRIARDEQIQYAVYDSVAFACDGPPEAAESAGRYFRSVREIGVGSCHIAHINKGENADKKPFGSAFWHNGARSTWFAKVSEPINFSPTLTLGLFQRKCNLGALQSPIGFRIEFDEARTIFTRTDVRENPDLAESMTIRQRMAGVLRRGSMDPADVAEEIDAKEETVTRTARRYRDEFVVLNGGKLALRQPDEK